MGVLTSGQIAVRPFRLEFKGSLEQLAAAAKKSRYVPNSARDKPGWGGPLDDDAYINIAPVVNFTVGDPQILDAEDGFPRRLRLRYYWVAPDPLARRRFGDGANWKQITVLQAADILIYESTGAFTGLITSRERTQFKMAANAIKALAKSVHANSQVAVDVTGAEFSEDFFFWMFYRFQTSGDVGNGLTIGAIHELSSQDRQFRNARFSQEATIDRIELAALIALGKAAFGPAKAGIVSTAPDALFELELHTDGGFQPFRKTHYENLIVDAASLGPKMIDDLWVKVLPTLRKLHRDDASWNKDGRIQLHKIALDQVKVLLDLRAN